MLELKVIEIVPRREDGSYLRVNVELQEDFSLDQALSLYLLDTIPALDREARAHAAALGLAYEHRATGYSPFERALADGLRGTDPAPGTTLGAKAGAWSG